MRQESEQTEKIDHNKANKLSAEDLHQKAWWRFARAIFGLGSAILIILTLLGLGIALNGADIVDKDQSEFQCSSGEQYQLSKIIKSLDITIYYSSEILNSHFTGSYDNAKAKIFCQVLNYNTETNTGPLTWIDLIETDELTEGLSKLTKETLAAFVVYEASSGKYGTLSELAEDKYVIAQTKNVDYTIDIVYDFSDWYSIFGLTLLALIIEAIVLLTIRGIARYTLIGKFF